MAFIGKQPQERTDGLERLKGTELLYNIWSFFTRLSDICQETTDINPQRISVTTSDSNHKLMKQQKVQILQAGMRSLKA